jgi:hypothetical protein
MRPDLPLDSGSDPESHLRETLIILDELVDRLSSTTQTGPAVEATVEAIREGTGAETAFWYSKATGRVSALAGPGPISAADCGAFARKLVAAIPPGEDVFRWADPSPVAGRPAAALVVRSPRSGGSVFAIRFDSDRRFDASDEEIARMAMKMLVGIRTHAQVATKQILNGLLHSLTAVLDAKDPYTAGHSERVARIAVLLVKQLGSPPASAGDCFLAGLIHDIGKTGVRDEVLGKAGKLEPAEYDEIKQHPVIGEKIVSSIEPFRRLCPAVRHHHERFDGTGYPDGLSGESIPFLGRVLAVADAIDAMMSPRRYRPARSPIEIDAILQQESGRQFDPSVVRAFMAVREQVYPPIYQKGIGESAYHAIVDIIDNQTETVPTLPGTPGRP